MCVLCKSRFPARCEPDSHAPTGRYVRPLLCGERLDVQAMVAAGRLRSGSYLEALRLVLRAHVHRLLLSCRFFYGVGSVARWFWKTENISSSTSPRSTPTLRESDESEREDRGTETFPALL